MALSTTSGADVHYSNHDTSAPSHIDTNHLTWTPAHEARLALVQAQLSAAQARWSEEQELWLGEVGPICHPNSAVIYPDQTLHPLSIPEATRSGFHEEGKRNSG